MKKLAAQGLRFLFVGALLSQLSWTNVAWSQQPPPDGPPGGFPGGFPGGPGGPGFPGGPGGPGFGGPGFGRPGMGMFGFAGPQGSMLSVAQLPEVVTELKISSEQSTQLGALQGDVMSAMQEKMADFNPQEMFELEEVERMERMAKMRSEMDGLNAEFDKKLADILDESQLKRLRELSLQRQGLVALLKDEFAEKLKLSDEQKQLIRETQHVGMPPRGNGGFPDFEGMERTRQEGEKKFLASLSDEQKTTWDALRGAAFTFTSQPPMGRGMMGGPGGMGGREKALVAKYDTNKDGWLNRAERDAAREEAKQGGGGPGGPGGMGRGMGRGGMGGGRGGNRGNRPAEEQGGPPAGPDGVAGGPGGFPGGPGGFPGGPGGPGGFPGGPGGFPGGPGGPGGMGSREPGKPGVKVAPSDVKNYADEDLYDTSVVRTIFLTFEKDDWESELSDFKNSDVEVDAQMMVDGKTYEKVGVKFRGMSSFGMVPAGSKRSFNISMDMADEDQRLLGYKTLNLLNSNGDPTMMHSVLYSKIARKYLPTPKANEVRVVVNGEDWGVYQNAQQFDKVFVKENFGSSKGARWKVSGSPGGGGSLRYLGDDVAAYKRLYEIKSSDNEESWNALIELTKILGETPPAELPAKIEPILDVDGALRFLALDVALINEDGYWVRGSDYSIYQDEDGKFHVIPHDMNESFMPVMGGPGMGGPGMGGPGMGGPGMGGRGRGGRGPGAGGPGAGGPQNGPGGPQGGPQGGRNGGGQNAYALDPLIALDNPDRPLRSKLLQVPEYRERYLKYVAQIAEEDLDWKNLGPVVEEVKNSIEILVELDSRKMSTTEAFQQTTSQDSASGPQNNSRHLRQFAEMRREYLLKHPEIVAVMKK